MQMIEKIKELQKKSAILEPSANERRDLFEKTFQHTEVFLSDIKSKKAFSHDNGKSKGVLKYLISEEPEEMDTLLKLLRENVEEVGLSPASPGYVCYVPGGGLYPSALGDFIADIINRYATMFNVSPGAVRIENMLIRWMADLIGYPKSSAGALTSGGSIAHLSGIVTAREAHKIKAQEIPKLVIYSTHQVHHSVGKAIRIAGLGEAIKRSVPMDENYRMNVGELEKLIRSDKEKGLKPFLIVASAGTTDTGAVDPISEIGDIASKHGIWFHVDAAYGGFFLLTEEGKNIIKGLEKTDSVIMDPHKGLFLPFGTGALIVKDKHHLLNAHYYTADYLQDISENEDELSPADLSPELSRNFRGLRLWLPLKLFGLKPFRAALKEKIYLTRYFYEKIQELPGFEVGPYPDLSVCTFRFVPPYGDTNEFNKKLVEEIKNDGRVFLSSTIIDRKFTIRLAVLSFRTHLEIVDLVLEILKEKTKKLILE